MSSISVHDTGQISSGNIVSLVRIDDAVLVVLIRCCAVRSESRRSIEEVGAAVVYTPRWVIYSNGARHTTTSPAGAMVARKTSIRSYPIERNLEAVGSSPTWGFSFTSFALSRTPKCVYLVRNVVEMIFVFFGGVAKSRRSVADSCVKLRA
jgi:hypothetical protein